MITYLTTSWDDGHPLDLRVAELLTKYGMQGTFYVPVRSETETMSVSQLHELSRAFEIGAHTINHVVLTRMPDECCWEEIADSKAWIEDNTGRPCSMFCPPRGKYVQRHTAMVRKAGYAGLRSTEMLSLAAPSKESGVLVLPTTIQAYPHDQLAYLRNVIRRTDFGNLWRFIVYARSAEWSRLASSLLYFSAKYGGVFHLWGHSWELQNTDQWQRLEEVLRLMAGVGSKATAVTNGQLCEQPLISEIAGTPRAASDEQLVEAKAVSQARPSESMQ
jgi:peptidoglycan-N-acetylglucosamine deacetylase